MSERGKLPLVVLISGNGSNLQAIIDAAADKLAVELCAVFSNRPDAYGLNRAQQAGIPTQVLDHREFEDREQYDRRLMELIDSYRPGLLVLAGYMRILSPAFVRHYQGRLLNIHPSLLPKYPGLHTHQRALDAAETLHGASVHFVTDELDGGPVIVQAQVPVLPGDDKASLAARVLEREHRIYPLAIRWFAEGRLKLQKQGEVLLDGQPLSQPVLFTPEQRID